MCRGLIDPYRHVFKIALFSIVGAVILLAASRRDSTTSSSEGSVHENQAGNNTTDVPEGKPQDGDEIYNIVVWEVVKTTALVLMIICSLLLVYGWRQVGVAEFWIGNLET